MRENGEIPYIFDIRGFSLDDGPGIRSTVFLKGCPLSCVWCHNPESWKAERELAFYPGLCIGCGDCVRLCREGAVQKDLPVRIQRDRCTACGECAEACPSTALKVVGRQYAPAELVGLLLKNRFFYETSGGGVTFSGGEPTLHMDYLKEVMEGLKRQGVHVALQTCGLFELDEFREKLLPFVDLIFYDVKFLNAEMHRKYTGMGNERILKNLVRLMRTAKVAVIPRAPLVPGITASEKNLGSLTRFLKNAGCGPVELLPYHPGGLAKARAIGKPDGAELPPQMMGIEEENRWRRFVQEVYDEFRSVL